MISFSESAVGKKNMWKILYFVIYILEVLNMNDTMFL